MSKHTPAPFLGLLRQGMVPTRALTHTELATLAHLARTHGALLAALSDIVESATDGRDVPEWLTERINEARAAIADAERAP